MIARKAHVPLAAALLMTALVAPVHAAARVHAHAARPNAPIALVVAPANPLVGHPVTLSVPNPPAHATDYRWRLTGAPAVDTGATPRATVRFATPGTHSVEVLVTAGPATREGELTVTVRPARTGPAQTRPAQKRAAAAHHGSEIGKAGGAIGAAISPRARLAKHLSAHAAASDPTVTIADFQFTPATITIHVGDTVTWVNHGPSAHTATASNNSFNTGVLQKGQSASHTFTTAGTFSYICSIHPFMHGTVIVLANKTSTTTTPTTTSTTPATTTTSTTPASTAGQLPMTGFALTATVLAGLLLTGIGISLRKKSRRA